MNGSPALNKSKSISDYSDIIPIALAVYLVGGGDALESLMMSLLKEAVLGMAQNAGDIKGSFSGFFTDADKSYQSLLYLAQDLDLNDKAYDEVKKKAQEKGLELKEYAGSTQLLNSYSKLNSFEHPAYSNVYSYGLPTIGNGRRTLADFADQVKNHVSKEKLQQMLTESVSAKLAENDINVESEVVGQIVSNAMSGDFSAGAELAAAKIAQEYDIPVAQISDCVQDVSTLSKLKFNKENLSSSILKIISIVNKYLPEKYKSELFSTFIDEYSETLSKLDKDVKEIQGNLRMGMDMISGNLSNYAIHFFDEGTFDVPAFSAIGKNVKAFKESDVARFGYSLKDYVQEAKSGYDDLNDYMDYVSKAGELEEFRQDVDLGLKIGCTVAESVNPGAGKACRAAQFTANVTLIANVSKTIQSAMKKVEALKGAKFIAVKKSIERKKNYSSWRDHEGNLQEIESSDMEKMLFGTPIISLQTAHKKSDTADAIIPLALYKTFDKAKNVTDISKDSAAFDYMFPANEFVEVDRNSLTNSSSVMVKDIRSEQRNGLLYKDSRYAALDAFVVRNFIEEYRFIIDDFQPDELRLIKFDFNARKQIAFERKGDSWYIYRGTNNKWEPDAADTLSESPVQKNGLFVFRPKDILNLGIRDAKDSILLSAIQEDGANSVSIYVVDKIGNANNQRINFKYQAVDYIMDEGWPKSFESVSKMDTVSLYANDWGYGATAKKYRLIVSSVQSQDTVEVHLDSLEGAGARFRFWADLSSIWKKHPLGNYIYTLKWDLGFFVKTLKADNTTGEQEIKYTPQTIVYGDVSAPVLAFDSATTQKTVSFNNDNAFAYVLNLDSLDNRALRGLRSFMVRRDTKDTIGLLNKAHVGEPSYEIGKNGTAASWSGLADLYVQAYDFANPDGSVKASLVQVAKDSAKSSWSLVMKNDTTFKAGINGISIHRPILVDNELPQVTNDSVTVLGSADISFPVFVKKNGSGILLNARDTLAVSFAVNENLFGRDSEFVSVELAFKDSTHTGEIKWKRYLSNFTVDKTAKRFVFEEPEANRLGDGSYSLTVILVDEVGNRSEKRILENLRVDRTAPEIRGVTLGDVAYANVAELKKGTAFLRQSVDDSRNLSDLACYVKVNVNDKQGKWIGPVVESESKKSLNSNLEFDIKTAVTDSSKGIWYVYFGCYDDAGNFGTNMNFMGMGSRYPEITYPQSGSGYYTNRILIKGIAPNPDVHGNSNNGEFQILWKKADDSTWSEKGIDYLVFDRSLFPTERDLAVWNIADLNLEKGDYVVKLSVRECDTCKWSMNEKTIPVDDFVPPDSQNTPKLVITPAVGNHVAGYVKDISIELKNVPDTSKWRVSASIEAPSPKDSTVYIRTLGKTFDPMTISPFRTPALASDTGLSIWQENDDSTWHVRYAGKALGLKSSDTINGRKTPYVSIRFVDGNIDWMTSPNADSTESLGFRMDSVRVKTEDVDLWIPPYTTTKKWMAGTDSVHLIFKTTEPFAVEASEIDSALYKRWHSPVVYVLPETYKAHVAWNGLVNGTYPSGSLVRMNVVAYEKGNEKNIIRESVEWYLDYENTKIEISSNNLNKYYVNFLGSNSDSSEAKTADYGFQFKLTGRSAFVWAEILDSAKNVAYTLLDSELVLATTTNQWQTLRWNGVDKDSFVKAGSYSVHLLVKNDKGAVVIDTLYPFEMNHGDNIKEAVKDSHGNSAELTMLEAVLDSNGNYRYVGKPDYLLRTDISATVLPEESRTFRYEWDVYGQQYPVEYKKTRPSLGIRRHRDEFWVTVVTLVMSESRDYNGKYHGVETNCDVHDELNGYYYTIQVQRMQLMEGKSNEFISMDLDPINNEHNDGHIYGFQQTWRAWGVKFKADTLNLHALAAIKVLPASSYAIVVASMYGNTSIFGNAVSDAGYSKMSEFSWDGVYIKSSYNDFGEGISHMRNWFNNWGGQALYYEAVNTNFKPLAKNDSLQNVFNGNTTKKTVCETENILDQTLTEDITKFVCGAKSAKEEIDTATISQFNPHAFMMNVKLVPVDDNKTDFVEKNMMKNTVLMMGLVQISK